MQNVVFPYIVVEDGAVRCLCKGCGTTLWEELPKSQSLRVVHPGALVMAMVDPHGVLSQHSTVLCPQCATFALSNTLEAVETMERWWQADIFHWFIEERCRGASAEQAMQTAEHLAGNRSVVRALRYDVG